MSDVVFHPAAEREFVESAGFYEAHAHGLGGEFIRAVERTVARIIKNPEAGSVFAGDVRRQLVRRFPYAVLYLINPESLWVVAVMHLRRRPGYWRGRLPARR